MKRMVLIFYLLLLVWASGYSQGRSKPYKWPGFVQLNDSVFVSETEISIADYAEFLHVMKYFFGSYQKLEDALPYPGKLGWMGYMQSMNNTFPIDHIYDVVDPSLNYQPITIKGVELDSNVNYDPYIAKRPIVNITKEQAMMFCELRTRAYRELYNNMNDQKGWRLPNDVYFRLPTEEEWIAAANGKRDSAVTKDVKLRVQPNNVIVSGTYYEYSKTGEWIPSTVDNGNINSIGLVNMCGNVAEMVMDSENVLGGSFIDKESDCTTISKYKMNGPDGHIGFRIVAVVRKMIL